METLSVDPTAKYVVRYVIIHKARSYLFDYQYKLETNESIYLNGIKGRTLHDLCIGCRAGDFGLLHKTSRCMCKSLISEEPDVVLLKQVVPSLESLYLKLLMSGTKKEATKHRTNLKYHIDEFISTYDYRVVFLIISRLCHDHVNIDSDAKFESIIVDKLFSANNSTRFVKLIKAYINSSKELIYAKLDSFPRLGKKPVVN